MRASETVDASDELLAHDRREPATVASSMKKNAFAKKRRRCRTRRYIVSIAFTAPLGATFQARLFLTPLSEMLRGLITTPDGVSGETGEGGRAPARGFSNAVLGFAGFAERRSRRHARTSRSGS